MWSTGRVGVVAVAGLALAGAASAAGPLASLPPGWSHASVNVVGPHGQAHTVVYDRGKVTSVGPLTLTLKELDGSIVTVAVSPKATINLNAHSAPLSQVQPGDAALTVGIDGAPAIRVQVTVPPPAPVATFGTVVSIGPQASSSSVTLKESNGSVVTIPISPNADVFVNGRLGLLSQVQPGFAVSVAAVPGQPARSVRFTASASKQSSAAAAPGSTP
jgi:hypothetical protein